MEHIFGRSASLCLDDALLQRRIVPLEPSIMTAAMPDHIEHVLGIKPNASPYDLQLDGTKIGFYRDRVEAWARGERVAPVTMDVAWTRKCNASCNFCYAQLQSSEGQVITKQN